MSDPNQPRNLSEISHLFLSGIRQKQTQGAARPQRMPPPRMDESIDLTPEEFAEVFGDENAPAAAPIGPITAVIASHLGANQLSRVQQYASHLCPQGKRLGLIAVDACEFRLSIFEHNPQAQSPSHIVNDNEILDPRKMTEALQELAWDVDRWLILLPSTRAPEARSLLREISHWTLLSTCDHDGVVSCYRTLKGLSDLNRPRLSLALLDPPSEVSAANAHQRVASVCRQFLDWQLESESPVTPSSEVREQIVLWCSGTRDKAQLATAPQWQVVADFLAKARRSATIREHAAVSNPLPIQPPAPQAAVSQPQIVKQESTPMPAAFDASEVIDLPEASTDPASIVHAVLHGNHDLVECPIKPPMYPEASLAVSRDHHLVLIAVAQQGLSDLRLIGRAYQWLIENRALINMAVPQMSIDAHAMPRVQLLVDHADMSADVLQPILQTGNVSVQAYRKLRWAGKTGLLLEAA
jgi:hypothetical protein